MEKYEMLDTELERGNKLVGNLKVINSKITFKGKNNILLINGDLTLVNSAIEFRGDNSLIYLCGTFDKITLDIKVYHNSTCYFGEDVWINRGIKIVISEETNVFFGRECLISYDTCIRTGDPHLVYDVDSKKRINVSKSVYVGDHVWIGQDVMILKGAMIGSGSIIGAKSLVTGKKYKSNASYGGNPVKLVKDNVFFLRDNCHYFKSDDTLESTEYNSDDYIYSNDGKQISFDVIEHNLRTLSIEERITYLNDITDNKDKNRFYIGE